MQCPICGYDRKIEEKKCHSCGVVFIDWVKKIITRLEMKTKQIENKTACRKKGLNPINQEAEKYKEVIRQA